MGTFVFFDCLFFQVAPMSMHASFGAEAAPLRDAFVSRLKTLTEVLACRV